jgi:carbonic anhydrase
VVSAAVIGLLSASSPVLSGSPAGGDAQSPVDIRRRDVTFVGRLAAIRVRYPRSSLEVVNTGSPDQEGTIRSVVKSPARILVKGNAYRLEQFHFHTPSEHRRGGEEFPMELHLVHAARDGRLLVLGVFLEFGEHHRTLRRIFRRLPADPGGTRTIIRFNLEALLPSSDRTHRYWGSLTTPPFTEGVRWIGFREPLEMSARQIARFEGLFSAGNAREQQPLNDRPIRSDLPA